MGFEQCHPAVNLIYFIAVIYGMITFLHPVFLLISFVSAFLYSVKKNGRKALVFNLILTMCIGAFALYYSTYTHFGITIIKKNMIGNNITLESILYGGVLGVAVVGVMMWFSCVYSIFSTDKVVYLFGRVNPKLSLYFSVLLRLVPRIKQEAKKINTAQCGIGKGINQGNIFERLKNMIRIFSILVTWLIDATTMAAESMQSRGSTMKGRTAFSIYRFDNRDRAYVVSMFTFLTVTFIGVAFGQTNCIYNPRIIMPPVTFVSNCIYIGYLGLCIMPIMLELWTEYSFEKSRSKI